MQDRTLKFNNEQASVIYDIGKTTGWLESTISMIEICPTFEKNIDYPSILDAFWGHIIRAKECGLVLGPAL